MLAGSIVFLWCREGQSLVRNVSQYVTITSAAAAATTVLLVKKIFDNSSSPQTRRFRKISNKTTWFNFYL